MGISKRQYMKSLGLFEETDENIKNEGETPYNM